MLTQCSQSDVRPRTAIYRIQPGRNYGTVAAAPVVYRVRPPYTVYTRDARVRPSQMQLGTAPKISPVFKGSLSHIFVIKRRTAVPSCKFENGYRTFHSSTFGVKEGSKGLVLATVLCFCDIILDSESVT